MPLRKLDVHWAEAKSTHFVARLVMAAIGLARTIAVIRLLPLEAYALVGIVESIRALLLFVSGFGLSDASEREMSVEKDRSRIAALFWCALAVTTGLSLLIAGLLMLSASTIQQEMGIAGLATPLAICGISIVAERIWMLVGVLVRKQQGWTAYLVFTFSNSVLAATLVVLGVFYLGVPGYFHALWLVPAVGVLLNGTLIARQAAAISWADIRTSAPLVFRRLWKPSVASLQFKGSAVLWRRAPVLIVAGVLEQSIVGAMSIVLDLTWKIHMLQQAVGPVVIAKLSESYEATREAFGEQAWRDIRAVCLATLLAAGTGVLIWELFGRLIVGQSVWAESRLLLYYALALDLSLFLANILFICVALPSRQFSVVVTLGSVIRIATIPFAWIVVRYMYPSVEALFLAFVASGVLVAGINYKHAIGVLKTIQGHPV